MGNIAFLKRALPFLGTFALGLFVASFFVNISPRFEHHERGRCHREMWQMSLENEQLREENQRLQDTLDSVRGTDGTLNDVADVELNLIPPSVEEPVAPPPPPSIRLHAAHRR